VGRARIAGLEADVLLEVADRLYAGGSVTWQDARDALRYEPGTRSPSPTYGLRLPNLPWLFGSAFVEASPRDFLGVGQRTRLFAEADYTAEFFYAFEVSRRQSRRIPAALTLGLGAEHTWSELGLSVAAEVRNLLDARVLNLLNNPLPGRSFHLKLRYTLVPSSG
jgi:outer membrane receptor protein involved in Fe transport